MTDETVKRIEEEAEKYGSFRTTDRYKKIKVNSYIAGAKSERNKVLDEAIACLKSREKGEYDSFLNDSYDKHAYGKYCAFKEAAQELESLKL